MSEQLLTQFGRALRDEGVGAGTGRVLDFCRAAALLEPADLYWAGRATLVARRGDLPVYDRVFREFFGGERAPVPRPRPRLRLVADEVEVASASAVELLRTKSFADCSPRELAQLAELMRRMRLAVPERRSRRREPAARARRTCGGR